MAQSSMVSIRDSITTQLIVVVFSVYFIVTLTVTLIHMGAEYVNTREGIRHDLITFQETFELGLAESVWNVNHDQLDSTLSGIIRIPIIVGVKVMDIEGQLQSAHGTILNDAHQAMVYETKKGVIKPLPKATPAAGVFGHEFNLKYKISNKTHDIGKVTLYSSNSIVLDRVQYGFIFIIVNSVIKTMSLWVIFLFYGRRLLSRPLSILTNATADLDLDNVEQVKLNLPTREKNELKVLESAFNRMTQKLSQSRKRLASFTEFTKQLGAYHDPTEMLRTGFTQMLENVPLEYAALVIHPESGKPVVISQPDSWGTSWNKVMTTRQWGTLCATIEPMNVKNLKTSASENQAWASLPMFTKMKDCHCVILQAKIFDPFLIILARANEEFGADDLRYLQTMLNEIIGIQRSLYTLQEKSKIQNELKTASAVQHALFPKQIPNVKNFEIATFFQSASETGGDWYGFATQIENYLYIMIGDVTGHGTPAAIVTATASAASLTLETLFSENKNGLTPENFLQYINRAVFSAGYPNYMMTFFTARIDLRSGRMEFANAGHNFPFLYRAATGEVECLLNANSPLGYRQDYIFEGRQIDLQAGDTLLFYTDGVVENQNKLKQMWGYSRLQRFFKSNALLPVKEIVHKLVLELYSFYESEPLADDMTVVSCKVLADFEQSP